VVVVTIIIVIIFNNGSLFASQPAPRKLSTWQQSISIVIAMVVDTVTA